jgi:glutathione peroxidase
MKPRLPFVILLAACGLVVTSISGAQQTQEPAATSSSEDQAMEEKSSALSFTMRSIDGEPVELTRYRGKVVLIVNVASRCGLTPQYKGLQSLYEKYGEQGFVVLGFPCNQFLGQEPGDEAQIKQFCETKYQVQFPLFSKIHVNGDRRAPLYTYLTAQETQPAGPGDISWNFEKFLIGRDGNVIGRFIPRTKPDDAKLTKAIESALSERL